MVHEKLLAVCPTAGLHVKLFGSPLRPHSPSKLYMAPGWLISVAERICRAAVNEYMHAADGSRNQWCM